MCLRVFVCVCVCQWPNLRDEGNAPRSTALRPFAVSLLFAPKSLNLLCVVGRFARHLGIANPSVPHHHHHHHRCRAHDSACFAPTVSRMHSRHGSFVLLVLPRLLSVFRERSRRDWLLRTGRRPWALPTWRRPTGSLRRSFSSRARCAVRDAVLSNDRAFTTGRSVARTPPAEFESQRLFIRV